MRSSHQIRISRGLKGELLSQLQHLFLLADISTRYMFLRSGKLTVRKFYSIKPLLEQKAMMKLTYQN